MGAQSAGMLDALGQLVTADVRRGLPAGHGRRANRGASPGGGAKGNSRAPSVAKKQTELGPAACGRFAQSTLSMAFFRSSTALSTRALVSSQVMAEDISSERYSFVTDSRSEWMLGSAASISAFFLPFSVLALASKLAMSLSTLVRSSV